MGFRFRQILKIVPGLRLNLSKSGVSASVGGPGATVNIGKKGVTGTVGLPGSGLSYTKTLRRAGGKAPPQSADPQAGHPDDPIVSPELGAAYDELLDLTTQLVVTAQNASTSWLQRMLKVNRQQAEELLAQLEADGVVSAPDRVGRRKVLVRNGDVS